MTHDLDDRLAPAPRAVPREFLIAELIPFRWWYVLALFLVAIGPIWLWSEVPVAFGVAGIATLAVLAVVQTRAARTRLALLRWGAVAHVTGSNVVSRGTYYSGTTYQNVWLPLARGWSVARERWSGPKATTDVHYALHGWSGTHRMGGRPYENGVILAHEQRPEVALCVSAFPYDLERDDFGNWIGRLRPRLIVGMVVWVVLLAVWAALIVYALTR